MPRKKNRQTSAIRRAVTQMNELPDPSQMFMSTSPPGHRDRRLAAGVMSVSAAVFIALVPFADRPLPQIWAFIPLYQSALIVNDFVTAALLVGQFAILRSTALLVLAFGYLFTGFMGGAHALTFPGLFTATGLLGAGEQTTAWLYMFWHGAFPVAIAAYALWKPTAQVRSGTRAVWIGACIAAALLATSALVVLTTTGHALLPHIMAGHFMTPSLLVVVWTVWGLNLAALVILWQRRPHAILDIWLMVALGAWLLDIALSSIFNRGRFDLGFYAGRIYGLLASSTVLFALLFEHAKLYAHVVNALAAERTEHLLVQEKTAQLNEANARLEHRVAARTRELTASNAELRREIEERERAERALKTSREEVRELSATCASAREAERRRIARELHDELGQTLGMLKVDLDWLMDNVPQDDAHVARKIASMHMLLSGTIKSARRIASDLRPLVLDDLGFVAATHWLVTNVEQRYGIHCKLTFHPADPALVEPYATAVFRIVQEALTNIARHAHASHADITVALTDSHILLRISDDGTGFDLTRPRKSGSYGLIGLRERAYLLGGTFEIEASPGNGTTVEVRIPLETSRSNAQPWASGARSPGPA